MRVLPWKLPRTDSCSYGSESKLKILQGNAKSSLERNPPAWPPRGAPYNKTIQPERERGEKDDAVQRHLLQQNSPVKKKPVRRKTTEHDSHPWNHIWIASCHATGDTQKKPHSLPSISTWCSVRQVSTVGGRGLYRGGGRHTSGELRWEGGLIRDLQTERERLRARIGRIYLLLI